MYNKNLPNQPKYKTTFHDELIKEYVNKNLQFLTRSQTCINRINIYTNVDAGSLALNNAVTN